MRNGAVKKVMSYSSLLVALILKFSSKSSISSNKNTLYSYRLVSRKNKDCEVRLEIGGKTDLENDDDDYDIGKENYISRITVQRPITQLKSFLECG